MRALRIVGSILVLLAATSAAQAQTPSTNLDDYVMFATLEIRTRGLAVTDGNIGVNSPGGQIYSAFAIHAPLSDLAASRVRIPTSECRSLFANDAPLRRCGASRRFASPFANSNAVLAACGYPTSFPPCGGADLTVQPSQAFRLPEGTYNNIVVRGGINPGRLILLGGTYRFCSLKTGRNTDILFDSATQVFIDGDVEIGGTGFSGGDIGSPDVRMFVSGTRVKVRPHARLFGRMCAPNAKMKVRWGAKLFGSFVAQKFRTDHITVRGLPAGVPGSTTTTTTTRPATTSTTATTTTRPATTSTSTTTTTTTRPAAACGNGLIDPGEACDPPGGVACPAPGGSFVACGQDCSCPLAADFRCCVPPSPAGGFVDCELLKPAECAAQGGVLLGVGSCDPSPCGGISLPSTTAPPTTSTTTTTRPTTTSTKPTTTTLPGVTTTSTPATTTTTTVPTAVVPVPVEVCGNCIDDDGNGATDFEDAACCSGAQRFDMTLKNGRIKPRGTTSALKLQSKLATSSGIDPRRQDVFLQIRGEKGDQLFCAQVPASRFLLKHGGFQFWDHSNQVASAKGLQDMTVKVRRSGQVTFRTHGRRTQLSGASQGTLRITVGFRDGAQVASANRCAIVEKRFRNNSTGALLAP